MCERNKWMNFFFLFEVYIDWFQKRALSIKYDNFIIISILNDAMKKLIKYNINC